MLSVFFIITNIYQNIATRDKLAHQPKHQCRHHQEVFYEAQNAWILKTEENADD